MIHIAGSPVTVNGVTRQRCGWCGHLLVETDQQAALFEPEVLVRDSGGKAESLNQQSGWFQDRACAYGVSGVQVEYQRD